MNSEKGEIAHILQETRICFPKAMHKGSQQPMPLSVRNLMPSFVRWTPLLTLHMFNQVYYCCNERPWSKQLVYGGGTQVFGICFHIIGHHKRKSEKELKQDRDQEEGADAEVLTGLLLPTGLFSMDYSPCFI